MRHPTAEQILAEQEHPPNQAQQVDELLSTLSRHIDDSYIVRLEAGSVLMIREHIDLLRRQAVKAKNQRKTLKQLHRAHRAALLELRWLKSTIVGAVGTAKWGMILQETKSTLWRQFQKEDSVNG